MCLFFFKDWCFVRVGVNKLANIRWTSPWTLLLAIFVGRVYHSMRYFCVLDALSERLFQLCSHVRRLYKVSKQGPSVSLSSLSLSFFLSSSLQKLRDHHTRCLALAKRRQAILTPLICPSNACKRWWGAITFHQTPQPHKRSIVVISALVE